jgi:hypothetical protein
MQARRMAVAVHDPGQPDMCRLGATPRQGLRATSRPARIVRAIATPAWHQGGDVRQR